MSSGRQFNFSSLLRLIQNLSRKLDSFSTSFLNMTSERNGLNSTKERVEHVWEGWASSFPLKDENERSI